MPSETATLSADDLLGDVGTPAEPMPDPVETRSETDVLLGDAEKPDDDYDPLYVHLSNGSKVTLKSLKARQLFKLLRILTRGGAQYLGLLQEGFTSDNPNEFANNLIAVCVLAIPEAPAETFDFLLSMVDLPLDPVTGKYGSEAEEIVNLMNDPELEDVIEVVTRVVNDNKGDLVSLGKKLGRAFGIAQKTGQLSDLSSESPTAS